MKTKKQLDDVNDISCAYFKCRAKKIQRNDINHTTFTTKRINKYWFKSHTNALSLR